MPQDERPDAPTTGNGRATASDATGEGAAVAGDGLVGRIGGFVGELSAGAVAAVNPDAVVRQVDVDDVVARVDVNAVLDRVDVNELLDRVDVDRLLDRVDVDRLVDRVDVEQVARRANTGILGGDGILDVVRQQVATLDTVVTRTLRRVLGRSSGEDLSGDPADLQGDPAGLLSRVLASALDVAAAVMTFTLLAMLASTALTAILGRSEALGLPKGPWFLGLVATWVFLWVATTVSSLGRTPGMLLVGLSVQPDGDRDRLGAGQALLRTLVQGVGFVLFGLGNLPVLYDARRRAVEDLVADTVLVHDWGGRRARTAATIGDYLVDDDG